MTSRTPTSSPEGDGLVVSARTQQSENASTSEEFAAAQKFEREWWSSATNTFGEEAKQLTYAPRMGLVNTPQDGRWPVYDLEGRSVLDIGGGPVSMLLKTVNGGVRCVVDPCPYPDWVRQRYDEADIRVWKMPAEEYRGTGMKGRYEEAWIYNCLQHVIDPKRVIEVARQQANLIRIFEWIETPPVEGHPHTLHADELNQWLGGVGQIENVNENGAVGLCYYGVFPVGAGATWDPRGETGRPGPTGL